MNKEYCVYAHINKINGKIYVGQTKQNVNKRWQNGNGYCNNQYFTNAIRKYGWDNFEHIILIDGLTQEEANFYEDYYINEWSLLDRQYGYNQIMGGISSPFIELWKNEEFREKMKKQQSKLMKEHWKNEDFREKMSKSLKESWTEERRKYMSESMSNYLKKKWKDENYQLCRSESMSKLWKNEKTKDKMIENSRNNAVNNWKNEEYRKKMCRSVKNIETGLIFESAAEAARWCGLADRSGITKHLTGKTKSAGKHPETKKPLHWEYAAPEEVM